MIVISVDFQFNTLINMTRRHYPFVSLILGSRCRAHLVCTQNFIQLVFIDQSIIFVLYNIVFIWRKVIVVHILCARNHFISVYKNACTFTRNKFYIKVLSPQHPDILKQCNEGPKRA